MNRQETNQQGFTLFDMLAAIVIAGILAAISIASWQSFWDRQVLGFAQDQAFLAMRQAQANARRTEEPWRVSFREQEGSIQWAIHPATNLPQETDWQQVIADRVRIDPRETTLTSSRGIYRVEFDQSGNTPPPFGRFTLSLTTGGPDKRCVFVSTLLGTLRKAQNRPQPDRSGRYCY